MIRLVVFWSWRGQDTEIGIERNKVLVLRRLWSLRLLNNIEFRRWGKKCRTLWKSSGSCSRRFSGTEGWWKFSREPWFCPRALYLKMGGLNVAGNLGLYWCCGNSVGNLCWFWRGRPKLGKLVNEFSSSLAFLILCSIACFSFLKRAFSVFTVWICSYRKLYWSNTELSSLSSDG